MTRPIDAAAAPAVVSVERFDNVVQLTWQRDPEPLAGGRSGEEAASARQAHLVRCWRRSHLRRDLLRLGREHAVELGLVLAALFVVIHTLTGGGTP